MAVAPSLEQVPYTRIREIGELAMSMDGVLRLYFGESNLPTPPFIVDAAERALAEGTRSTRRTPALRSLRAAIAAPVPCACTASSSTRRAIVVTASGVQALHLTLRCGRRSGGRGRSSSPPPGRTARRSSRSPTGGPSTCRSSSTESATGSTSRGRSRALGPHTRAVLLTSPSNPLGWVATVEEQRRLLDLCRERGLWLVADEVYERIYYEAAADGDAAPSILRLATRDDPVLVVQSFSKTYCMTGWRVGWLVAPAAVAAKLAQLNEFFVSHAATFVQVAAQAALEEGEAAVAEMVDVLPGEP